MINKNSTIFFFILILGLAGWTYGDIITGLVGYYPFSGSYNDASPSGRSSVNYGATLTTDRFGNLNSAAYFSNTYIDTGLNSSNGLSNGDKTMSLWIRPDNPLNSGQGIFAGFSGEPNNNNRFYIGNSNGYFFTGLGSNGGDTSIPMLNTNVQWHHIVLVSSGTQGRVYQNGVLAGTISWPGLNDGAGNNFNIGRAGGSGNMYFSGIIDDVRIYNRALSALEVQELMIIPEPATFLLMMGAIFFLSKIKKFR